jgi:hypothetical protein
VVAAAAAAPALEARLAFDEEEREIVTWLTATDDPALVYIVDLRLLITAEEQVRRQLLLNRCVAASVYSHPDRLADEKYRRYIAEIGAALKSEILTPLHDDGRAFSNALAAAIFSYRAANPAERAAWRSYLRSPQAVSARSWANKLVIAQHFYADFALDLNSGAVHASWLHWLDEFLRRAGLRDAFVREAETVKPGLGAAFDAFVSSPVARPLPKARRDELNRLSSQFSERMVTIGDGMSRWLNPAAREAAAQWLKHPMVMRIDDVTSRIDSLGPGLPEQAPNEDAVVSFLRNAVGEKHELQEAADAMIGFVKTRVDASCSLLK